MQTSKHQLILRHAGFQGLHQIPDSLPPEFTKRLIFLKTSSCLLISETYSHPSKKVETHSNHSAVLMFTIFQLNSHLSNFAKPSAEHVPITFPQRYCTKRPLGVHWSVRASEEAAHRALERFQGQVSDILRLLRTRRRAMRLVGREGGPPHTRRGLRCKPFEIDGLSGG